MQGKLIVTKEAVNRFLITSCVAIFAVMIVVTFNNPLLHLVSVWSLIFAGIILCKFDFMHPYCWFSAAFGLYNTSYTILYCAGIQSSAGYSYYSSLYSIVALYIVLIIVGPDTETLKEYPKQELAININSTKLWYYSLALITLLFALILRAEGYSGKTAMKQANDIYYRLGVHFIRWMMFFLLLVLFHYMYDKSLTLQQKRWKLVKSILFGGLAALLFSLCTGERDVIFRFCIILIVSLFFFGIIKRRHIIILIPIGVVVLLASVYLKYALLGGGVNTRYFSGGNLLEEILSTDFLMAGRNFQWLLNFDWTKGYFGPALLFSELFYGLIPGITGIPVTSWFQNSVYPAGYKNVAFTLIGTGYVMCGIVGIAIIFIIVGLLIRWIYRKSNKNIYTMVCYIYSITVFCGSFRSTLNNLLMQLIKGIFVAYILHKYLCQTVSIKGKSL